MHLTKQVELLVDLAKLLLKLHDVIARMRVQLLELLPCLLQGMFLIRLPRLVILKLYLRLQDVKLLSQLLQLLIMDLNRQNNQSQSKNLLTNR